MVSRLEPEDSDRAAEKGILLRVVAVMFWLQSQPYIECLRLAREIFTDWLKRFCGLARSPRGC